LFFQLHGHAFGHQLGVHFGTLDFNDLDGGLQTRHLFHHVPEPFDVGALFADHQPRPGRVNVHAEIFPRPFNPDRETAASFRRSFKKPRILKSSSIKAGISLMFSHLESHSRM
jgi:hypothetical protein